MQKKWNVLIVPSSPGREVYSFEISLSAILTAAITAASLFIIALATVIYAGYNWKMTKAVQITNLQSRIRDRDAEVAKLNREFSMLEDLENKLRSIAGLEPRERERVNGAGGQGGPYTGTYEEEVSASSADIKRDAEGDLSADELLSNSEVLKNGRSEDLDKFIETQRLSNIPSLNPVASPRAWVSSGFGYRKDPINGRKRFHEGCDIVASRGTPVVSPADGIVSFAGWGDGMGNMVEIEHGYGYKTCYGHTEEMFVKRGDMVKRGDLIAYVGSSGRSTGPHLHYEVRHNGKLVNPYKFLVE